MASLCRIFDVYRSSYRQWYYRADQPDAKRVMKRSLVKELTIASCQVPAHKYKRGGNEYVEIPNLFYRQCAITQPNQVWCDAGTYLWTGKCWAYLAVVLDLFARKPVGWAMLTSPESALTVNTIQMAWRLCGRPSGVMFNSDQGKSPYTSRKYRLALVALSDNAKHE